VNPAHASRDPPILVFVTAKPTSALAVSSHDDGGASPSGAGVAKNRCSDAGTIAFRERSQGLLLLSVKKLTESEAAFIDDGGWTRLAIEMLGESRARCSPEVDCSVGD